MFVFDFLIIKKNVNKHNLVLFKKIVSNVEH